MMQPHTKPGFLLTEALLPFLARRQSNPQQEQWAANLLSEALLQTLHLRL